MPMWQRRGPSSVSIPGDAAGRRPFSGAQPPHCRAEPGGAGGGGHGDQRCPHHRPVGPGGRAGRVRRARGHRPPEPGPNGLIRRGGQAGPGRLGHRGGIPGPVRIHSRKDPLAPHSRPADPGDAGNLPPEGFRPGETPQEAGDPFVGPEPLQEDVSRQSWSSTPRQEEGR